MKLISGMILGTFFLAGAASASAAEEVTISDEQMAEIKASCEAESKNAVYPSEYLEQCVEEAVQALKEEQPPEKEAS
jgi:hypothetical protein